MYIAQNYFSRIQLFSLHDLAKYDLFELTITVLCLKTKKMDVAYLRSAGVFES